MQLKKLLTTINQKIVKSIFFLLIAAYPFIIFFALRQGFDFRFLSLVLLIFVLAAFVRHKNKVILFIGTLLCILAICFNQMLFLKIYPVFMNSMIAFVFLISLGKKPLITQIAQRMGTKMTPSVQKYTYKATLAWGAFMAINTAVSLITVFLSNNLWALYNGLISYILIAIMMAAEYTIRKISIQHDGIR